MVLATSPLLLIRGAAMLSRFGAVLLGVSALVLLVQQFLGATVIEALFPDASSMANWQHRPPPLAHWFWYASRACVAAGFATLAVWGWKRDRGRGGVLMTIIGASAVLCWSLAWIAGGAPFSSGSIAALPSAAEGPPLFAPVVAAFEADSHAALLLLGGYPIVLLTMGLWLWRLELSLESSLARFSIPLTLALGLGAQVMGHGLLASAEVTMRHDLWGVRWLWAPETFEAVAVWAGDSLVLFGFLALMLGHWLAQRKQAVVEPGGAIAAEG